MPQLEDGYTKIANELLEALARTRLSGESRQILDIIIRKTYGFNKTNDEIALSQFVTATGMSKPSVVRAIRKLQSMNIIFKDDNGSMVNYKINKYYLTWRPLSKKITYKPEPSLKEFCYLCGFKEALHKHHIVALSKNGEDRVKNKIVLCPNCHAIVHKGSHTEKELIIIKDNTEKRTKKDNQKKKLPLSKKSTTKENTKETTNTKEKARLGDIWIQWEQHRKEIRQKLTPTTEERQLKKLSKYPLDIATKMLEQSMDNGWTGIFELKDKASPKYDPQAGEKADEKARQIRGQEETINWANKELSFLNDEDDAPTIKRHHADIARAEREIAKLRGEM